MSRSEEEQERRRSDPLSVQRIADALREPVAVRTDWRADVLREIGELPPPAATRDHAARRWRFRPTTAIAAGLACALTGAAIATAIVGHDRRAISPDALTSLTATMPLPGEVAHPAQRGQAMVRFVFVAPYAASVSLVGDFNGWNASTMPMRRSADGRAWLLDVPLPAGRHVYAFVVDGDVTADPAAPRASDDFGVPSSVVLVSGART